MTRDDLSWLRATLPPVEIENLRQQVKRREAAGPPGLDELFQLQCRNLARNHDAGMVIGMGTDSGPLDDINNSRRIAQVYLRGDEVNREALRETWSRP